MIEPALCILIHYKTAKTCKGGSSINENALGSVAAAFSLSGGLPLKHIYMNSHLSPLLLAVSRSEPRTWIFSQGDRWLYLSPPRLARLAALLGLEDVRVERLIDLVRRHSPRPQAYCRPLGLAAEAQIAPEEYPIVLCPDCDGAHTPHPLDAALPCHACQEKMRRKEEQMPSDRVLRDRHRDRCARLRILGMDPGAFDGDNLSPNWRINHSRRLRRDWDNAVNRILMGGAYRWVAGEFDCSVGLLHRKVQESKGGYWENN